MSELFFEVLDEVFGVIVCFNDLVVVCCEICMYVVDVVFVKCCVWNDCDFFFFE